MTIHQQIMDGMAKAFFACAWADQCEEAGQGGVLSGRGIVGLMPKEIDPAAIHAAETLARDFVRAQPMFAEHLPAQSSIIQAAYAKALSLSPSGADKKLSPELFGHYLAMQAMGTGVGLESFGYAVRDYFRAPYVEFGGHSLSKDYFS